MQAQPQTKVAERWDAVKEIFAQAVDLPPDEWSHFLASKSHDVEVRAEVYHLLTALDPAANFFESFIREIGSTNLDECRLVNGQVLSGRFRIERFIAQGGMGEVYEAADLELGVRVALKTLKTKVANRDGSVNRFRSELKLARAINHPNICRVYDVSHDGEIVFFTMELLLGETLADRLETSGTFSISQARPLIDQMALALDAAHRVGVIHRDFKSSNVIVCAGETIPRVVVTDFGFGRNLANTEAGERMEGITPAYAAPEQIENKAQTAQTDIYSFGIVIFEMVTGQLPFVSDNAMDLARMRLHTPPRSPRSIRADLPRSWETAILRCLDVKPERRFKSALELSRALGCQATFRDERDQELGVGHGLVA